MATIACVSALAYTAGIKGPPRTVRREREAWTKDPNEDIDLGLMQRLINKRLLDSDNLFSLSMRFLTES